MLKSRAGISISCVQISPELTVVRNFMEAKEALERPKHSKLLASAGELSYQERGKLFARNCEKLSHSFVNNFLGVNKPEELRSFNSRFIL